MGEKWDLSQRMEREWWLRWKARTDSNAIQKERIDRAERINEILRSYFPADKTLKILQIGPAANGEIHLLPGERYAVDPLASFFKEAFPELMDPAVKFIDGVGEYLPYPGSFFDVILIINALDHCAAPSRVLAEIKRCLRNRGILILRVNTYNQLAAAIHQALGFLDREHPHALTRMSIIRNLSGNFKVKEKVLHPVTLPDYDLIKRLALFTLKVLRLSPVNYEVIAQKR